MRIRRVLTKGVLIALAVAFIPVAAVSAQEITPGGSCTHGIKERSSAMRITALTAEILKRGGQLVLIEAIA